MHPGLDPAARRGDLIPDPDTIQHALTDLRDAVARDGPTALAPAALGCLIVDLECLADIAAQLARESRPSLAQMAEYLRVALGHVAAYRSAAKDLRS